MKEFLNRITDRLADAALLEMGILVVPAGAQAGEAPETLEENLIEVAFAEAADYDEIHEAIQREHRLARPDASPLVGSDTQYRKAA